MLLCLTSCCFMGTWGPRLRIGRVGLRVSLLVLGVMLMFRSFLSLIGLGLRCGLGSCGISWSLRLRTVSGFCLLTPLGLPCGCTTRLGCLTPGFGLIGFCLWRRLGLRGITRMCTGSTRFLWMLLGCVGPRPGLRLSLGTMTWPVLLTRPWAWRRP